MIFFLIETWFGGAGVWYLVGLGATALLFSLLLPRGLWGAIEARFGSQAAAGRLPAGAAAQRRSRHAPPSIIQASNREGRKRMTMLLGKTILITGVASGIGARTAELAGQLGADVIGVDMLRTGDAVRRPSSRLTSRPRQASTALVSRNCPAVSTRSAMSPACPARPAPRRRSPSISTGCARFRRRWRQRSARAARSSTSPRSPASAGAPISTARPRWSASRAFPDVARGHCRP